MSTLAARSRQSGLPTPSGVWSPLMYSAIRAAGFNTRRRCTSCKDPVLIRWSGAASGTSRTLPSSTVAPAAAPRHPLSCLAPRARSPSRARRRSRGSSRAAALTAWARRGRARPGGHRSSLPARQVRSPSCSSHVPDPWSWLASPLSDPSDPHAGLLYVAMPRRRELVPLRVCYMLVAIVVWAMHARNS